MEVIDFLKLFSYTISLNFVCSNCSWIRFWVMIKTFYHTGKLSMHFYFKWCVSFKSRPMSNFDPFSFQYLWRYIYIYLYISMIIYQNTPLYCSNKSHLIGKYQYVNRCSLRVVMFYVSLRPTRAAGWHVKVGSHLHSVYFCWCLWDLLPLGPPDTLHIFLLSPSGSSGSISVYTFLKHIIKSMEFRKCHGKMGLTFFLYSSYVKWFLREEEKCCHTQLPSKQMSSRFTLYV